MDFACDYREDENRSERWDRGADKQPAPKEWSWYKNIYEKVRNAKLRKRLEQEEQSPKPAASRHSNHAIQQGPHRE